jgi:hypothetical protein
MLLYDDERLQYRIRLHTGPLKRMPL